MKGVFCGKVVEKDGEVGGNVHDGGEGKEEAVKGEEGGVVRTEVDLPSPNTGKKLAFLLDNVKTSNEHLSLPLTQNRYCAGSDGAGVCAADRGNRERRIRASSPQCWAGNADS